MALYHPSPPVYTISNVCLSPPLLLQEEEKEEEHKQTLISSCLLYQASRARAVSKREAVRLDAIFLLTKVMYSIVTLKSSNRFVFSYTLYYNRSHRSNCIWYKRGVVWYFSELVLESVVFRKRGTNLDIKRTLRAHSNELSFVFGFYCYVKYWFKMEICTSYWNPSKGIWDRSFHKNLEKYHIFHQLLLQKCLQKLH